MTIRYQIKEIELASYEMGRRFRVTDLRAEDGSRIKEVYFYCGILVCETCETRNLFSSSSCPHARAVRRLLKKEDEQAELDEINEEIGDIFP